MRYARLSRSALLALAIWASSPFFAAPAAAFPGLTDDDIHEPPASDTYAYDTFTPTNPLFPNVGESYVDPVFGTEITRLSDGYPNTGSGIIYGINGRWNADGTRYLHDAPDGGVHVIDVGTGAVIRTNVPYPYTSTAEVSFDPVSPDVYYFTSGTQLRSYNIQTGVTSTVKTFDQTLGGLGQAADWIDRTGRWFVLNLGGKIRVWDRQRNVLYSGSAPVSGIPQGWAGISPDGNYLIRSLNPAHYSHRIDHTTRNILGGVMFWDACYDHGDVVSTSTGKTYMLTGSCRYGSKYNGAWRVDVTKNQAGRGSAQHGDGVQILFGTGSGGHFSCAARGAYQDWCYISIESPDDQIGNPGTWRPYKQEIVAVDMQLPATVYRLLHHRSRPVTDYCRQPRVNANWDGTRIAFTSNMGALGTTGCGYSDLYTIDIR